MTRTILTVMLLLIPATAFAQQRCVVADPSGTPLNVRTAPNGRIVGALHNGTRVVVRETEYDGGGRPWAYVTPVGPGRAGFVFRDFLDCD